jgi:hypothetical protein
MNDRKRAWQILHIEIRRRANPETYTDDEMSTYATQVGSILVEAIAKSGDMCELIIELAGLGATFALMGRDHGRVRGVIDKVGALVMQEPDNTDEDES